MYQLAWNDNEPLKEKYISLEEAQGMGMQIISATPCTIQDVLFIVDSNNTDEPLYSYQHIIKEKTMS